jgi:hypothetical protein
VAVENKRNREALGFLSSSGCSHFLEFVEVYSAKAGFVTEKYPDISSFGRELEKDQKAYDLIHGVLLSPNIMRIPYIQ